MWLAHVGFYEYIGLIADGVFRIHGLYVAALCGSEYDAIRNKGLEKRLDSEENTDTSVVQLLFTCKKGRE